MYHYNKLCLYTLLKIKQVNIFFDKKNIKNIINE